MTRRRDVEAADDPALRLLADSFAPVCTLVGKTWSLHLEKVTQVDPEENLRMIADSVGVPARPGQARGLRRRALLRRLPRRRRLRAALPARGRGGGRRERDPVRHQRLVAARRRWRRPPRAVRAELPEVAVGIHTHDDAGCGVANSLVAVEAGATLVQGTVNGYGERCGNANLMTIVPDLQLKMGAEVLEPDAPGAAHRGGPPGGRAVQRDARTPTSPTWARTRSRTRAACTWPRSTATPARSSTWTRPRWAPTAGC